MGNCKQYHEYGYELTTHTEHNDGCGPNAVAKAVKQEFSVGKQLYDSYHYKLYSGISKYREEYVLETALKQGYLHLGLGARIYTDRPRFDIRTLHNATCQFWSILSVLALNKMHQRIEDAGYEEMIYLTATIYDSIYYVVKDDPKIIKWVNDNLIPIMQQDFLIDQIVHNDAALEIGPDWASLHKVEHNATLRDIIEIRSKWE